MNAITDLCRFIEAHCDEPLPLRRLAASSGLSPWHLARRFKAAVGLTPRQYHHAARLSRFKRHLRAGAPVTAAIYEAGFGSSSRVYENAGTALGMTPRQYRARGAGLAVSYATLSTVIGRLMIAATYRGICFVQFGDSEAALRAALKKEFPGARLSPGGQCEQLRAWSRALANHLRRGGAAPCLPLDLRGTAFQASVWRFLTTIPPGERRSYGEVAKGVGRPGAARAVARACATNPVAVLIPCHRVIRGNGDLGGYRWGTKRKRALLATEAERPAAG